MHVKTHLTYGSLHQWMLRHVEKTDVCAECGEAASTDWSFEGAYLGARGRYPKDPTQFRELCRPCHLAQDAARRRERRQA